MAIIAPSLLAANFLELGNACEMLNKSEAEWFHLDVMDGSFVPNISFGLPVIEQIRKATSKICDVHLMIVHPEKYITAFKKAGADILTVHYEACPHLKDTLAQIKAEGMKAGVAINPNTDVEVLAPLMSLDTLMLVKDTFDENYSGWGYDFLWPYLLEYPQDKIAIIDSIVMKHTKPVGTDYSRFPIHPSLESEEMLRRLTTNLNTEQKEYSKILL